MTGKDLIHRIAQMLIEANIVPLDHTGEVVVTINVSQGGVRNGKISVTEHIT